MRISILLFLLIFAFTVQSVSAVTCTVSPTSTTIDLGMSKKVTISCSDWDVNSVIVEATQYNAACLSLDKTSDTLTSGANSKDFTITATSMACQENINDRTIVWKFTPSSGTVPSKSTIVTIQSGLTITAEFKNAPYSAEEGEEINIILEISTTANENITGISIDVSGSSQELISAGLTEKSISKIAAATGEKTQQVSWTITAPSAGTYHINATVTSTNADSDTASTILTVTEASQQDNQQDSQDQSKPSSGGGGGGGGGGLLPPPLEAPSDGYESVTKYVSANKAATISLPAEAQELTGVTEIEVQCERTLTISATVSKVTSVPAGVPEPEGKAYSYFEIVFTEFGTTVKIEPSGSITYRISKEWLNSNGIKTSDIQFVKYDGNSWIELQSEMESEDENYYYFRVNLESFSLFAVVAKTTETQPSVTIPEMPEKTPETTSTPDVTSEATSTPATPEPTVRQESKQELPALPIAIGGIAIGAVAIAYLVKRRK